MLNMGVKVTQCPCSPIVLVVQKMGLFSGELIDQEVVISLPVDLFISDLD